MRNPSIVILASISQDCSVISKLELQRRPHIRLIATECDFVHFFTHLPVGVTCPFVLTLSLFQVVIIRMENRCNFLSHITHGEWKL